MLRRANLLPFISYGWRFKICKGGVSLAPEVERVAILLAEFQGRPCTRQITPTAPDEWDVTVHGWLRRRCVNVCMNRCKSLWIKGSAKCKMIWKPIIFVSSDALIAVYIYLGVPMCSQDVWASALYSEKIVSDTTANLGKQCGSCWRMRVAYTNPG